MYFWCIIVMFNMHTILDSSCSSAFEFEPIWYFIFLIIIWFKVFHSLFVFKETEIQFFAWKLVQIMILKYFRLFYKSGLEKTLSRHIRFFSEFQDFRFRFSFLYFSERRLFLASGRITSSIWQPEKIRKKYIISGKAA